MKKLTLTLFSIFGLAAAACAQPHYFQSAAELATQTNYVPRTEYETFAHTPGDILAGGWSNIGAIAAGDQVTFSMEVKVSRLTNLRTSNRVFAVVLITTTPNGPHYDYMDSSELDSVIHALQIISRTTHPMAGTDNSAASYVTRSGLLIMKYSAGGEVSALLKSPNGGPVNFFKPTTLDNLTDLFNTAKSNIQGQAQAGP